jgi:hypothetical protein
LFYIVYTLVNPEKNSSKETLSALRIFIKVLS